MAQTVIGLFDDESEAHKAVADLNSAGFGADDVAVVPNTDAASVHSMLTDASIPAQDVNFYAEGVTRGGTLVVVHTDTSKARQAADILSRYNMVDIDTRAADYRTAGVSNVGLSDLDESGNVLQVIEEELRVGKRQVQRGGVRIHTRVTERPVEQQVTLHEETVSVERRAVDRPVTDADAVAFKEQSFEVTETAEEAVVAKTARVVEEVVVGKQAEDRTETIRDTVRRQDVDVEDLRTTGTTTSTPVASATTTTSTATSATTTGTTLVDDDTADRDFYTTTYGTSGNDYDYYKPVFQYGRDLRTSDTYKGKNWNTAESDIRTQWEEQNPGTWEQFKAGIKHAWDRATNNR